MVMAVMVMDMDIGTILTGLMVGVIQTMDILHIGALVMVGAILIMADITALTTTTATVMEIILHTTEEEEIQHILQAEVPIGIVQIKMRMEEILTRALK